MEQTYGIIYKTTNLINGKTYIGQTIAKDKKLDEYLGSGILINKAIIKYGRENFEKEIICSCSSREQLNRMERLWIVLLKPDYNIAKGGEGGDLGVYWNKGLKLSEEYKRKISEGSMKNPPEIRHRDTEGSKNPMFGKLHSDEAKSKMSLKAKARGNNNFEGRKQVSKDGHLKYVRPEEIPKYVSEGWIYKESVKRKNIYVTNFVKEKRIPKLELSNYIKDGWVIGRLSTGGK